ncbi:MAG TPA: nucleotidyltransferase domain-containing protein [Chloroflexota bacterium]|nr:nucleotidyltransferase domain-containing protein [Chloroflexota bacterium]
MTTRGTEAPPTLEELRSVRDAILHAASLHHVTNVRVFGSVARAKATTRSDVDVLVDVAPECGGWEFFGILHDLRQDLEALLGRRVDVVSIRGPAPDARNMAAEIERGALPL